MLAHSWRRMRESPARLAAIRWPSRPETAGRRPQIIGPLALNGGEGPTGGRAKAREAPASSETRAREPNGSAAWWLRSEAPLASDVTGGKVDADSGRERDSGRSERVARADCRLEADCWPFRRAPALARAARPERGGAIPPSTTGVHCSRPPIAGPRTRARTTTRTRSRTRKEEAPCRRLAVQLGSSLSFGLPTRVRAAIVLWSWARSDGAANQSGGWPRWRIITIGSLGAGTKIHFNELSLSRPIPFGSFVCLFVAKWLN